MYGHFKSDLYNYIIIILGRAVTMSNYKTAGTVVLRLSDFQIWQQHKACFENWTTQYPNSLISASNAIKIPDS